jgi:hypothetical protein
MFGTSKKSESPSTSHRDDVVIHAIPDMFYGGKNPEIYQDHTVSPVVHAHVKPPQPNKPGVQSSTSMQSKHTSLIAVILLVCLCVVGGGAWYFLQMYSSVLDTGPTLQPIVVTPSVPVVVAPMPTSTVEETLDDSVAINSATSSTTSTVSGDVNYVFPQFGLFDAADLDGDSITDVEEAVYGTDPGIWDTDEDGYYDGQEIENLYSPTQIAPAKISTAVSVREYIHPQFGYRFLYPAQWQVAPVDLEGNQVIVSAITGEYVEIIRSEKEAQELFVQWYARRIGSQARYTDFSSYKNRVGFDVLRRPDWLVAFFDTPTAVYTVLYHSGNNDTVLYRRSMSLVMQSFVPFGTAAPIPEQEVISVSSSAVQ